MSEYKAIKGFKIQSLSSDPTADEGQIWYNTTSNVLKYDAIGAGAWGAGGAGNTGRRYLSIAGTQTSAVTCNGGPSATTATETYNGSAWTSSPAVLNSDKHNWGGLGQSGSAAMATGGGGYLTVSETWNGTSWAEGNNLTTGRTFTSAAGTTTSAILTLGETPGSPNTVNTEEWNGTSWTEVNNINSPGYLTGHSTDASAQAAWLIAGGQGRAQYTETWDGTCWSVNNELSRASTQTSGMGSAGTSTLGLVFGGYPSVTGLTEQWNGTSWTELADLTTARYTPGGCGTSTVALAAFGATPGTTTACEEWSGAPAVVKTVTVS